MPIYGCSSRDVVIGVWLVLVEQMHVVDAHYHTEVTAHLKRKALTISATGFHRQTPSFSVLISVRSLPHATHCIISSNIGSRIRT